MSRLHSKDIWAAARREVPSEQVRHQNLKVARDAVSVGLLSVWLSKLGTLHWVQTSIAVKATLLGTVAVVGVTAIVALRKPTQVKVPVVKEPIATSQREVVQESLQAPPTIQSPPVVHKPARKVVVPPAEVAPKEDVIPTQEPTHEANLDAQLALATQVRTAAENARWNDVLQFSRTYRETFHEGVFSEEVDVHEIEAHYALGNVNQAQERFNSRLTLGLSPIYRAKLKKLEKMKRQ